MTVWDNYHSALRDANDFISKVNYVAKSHVLLGNSKVIGLI